VFAIFHLIDHYPFRLLMLHLALGIISVEFSIFSTVWGWSMIIFALYNILKYRNHHNAAGFFAAYLVGLEIVLRMTNAEIIWEFGKYGIVSLFLLGLTMENFKRHRISVFIIIYIFSFFPSVFLVSYEDINIWRQFISFNLSGPLSLFFSFLYFRNRKVFKYEIIRMLRMLLLPLISMSMILIIRTPDLDEIVFTSEANVQMSGGYGPNQVSSALGLIVAIIALSKIFNRTLFNKDIYDYTILGICSIQAYLTFARGGVLTAILSIFSAWLISLGQVKSKTLRAGKTVYVVIILLILWGVAGDFTQGKMEQRYISILNLTSDIENSRTGRLKIMAIDLDIFMDNIIMGVGPGVARELRFDYGYNKFVSAHSEFTRTLSEHGLFGLLGLCSLIFLSFREYNHRKEQEKCILVCFAMIAILTMLHSAMRLAMPGFIFGMAFLKIQLTEKHL